MRSFTIVVTDNDAAQSYDASFLVDRNILPDVLYTDFLNALLDAAVYHARSGITAVATQAFAPPVTLQTAMLGLVVGLTASGVYSGVKAMAGGA